MKHEDEIKFEAINEGIGFYKDSSGLSSFYDPKIQDEDQIISKTSIDIFEKAGSSKDFYDHLTRHLEEPILESVHQTPSSFSGSLIKKEALLSSDEENLINFSDFEKESPLTKPWLPHFGAMKVDLLFSTGLFLLTWVMLGTIYGSYLFLPPILMPFLFGLVYQTYVTACRFIKGATLGEEKFNLTWNTSSFSYFALRGLLIVLTGFILIPLSSFFSKRDLLGEYTGLYLEYNI